jgi:hypothetical protein
LICESVDDDDQHRAGDTPMRTIIGVAVPPTSVKTSTADDLDFYASQRWPQLEEVTVTWRGSFGYVTGHLPGGEEFPLCRLRYLGLSEQWGFGLYQASTDGYEDSILPTGSFTGTQANPRLRLRPLPQRPDPIADRTPEGLGTALVTAPALSASRDPMSFERH